MEGPISTSAINRLPSAVQKLDDICQRVYIFLRLRKPEHEIANNLNLSSEQTRERIETIRSALIKAGQLDLIEDPKFVPIHSEDPDGSEIPLASNQMDADDMLIIKEFLSCIGEAVSALSDYQRRLLRLRYKHHMSATDIVGFCKRTGCSLIPNKAISQLKEQDIFYELNKALKAVLVQIRARYEEQDSLSMGHLKYIFEEIGV